MLRFGTWASTDQAHTTQTNAPMRPHQKQPLFVGARSAAHLAALRRSAHHRLPQFELKATIPVKAEKVGAVLYIPVFIDAKLTVRQLENRHPLV